MHVPSVSEPMDVAFARRFRQAMPAGWKVMSGLPSKLDSRGHLRPLCARPESVVRTLAAGLSCQSLAALVGVRSCEPNPVSEPPSIPRGC
jgi:hypothetical protein